MPPLYYTTPVFLCHLVFVNWQNLTSDVTSENQPVRAGQFSQKDFLILFIRTTTKRKFSKGIDETNFSSWILQHYECSSDTCHLIFRRSWYPSNLLTLFRDKTVAALFKKHTILEQMRGESKFHSYSSTYFSFPFFLLLYFAIILRNTIYIIALSIKLLIISW